MTYRDLLTTLRTFSDTQLDSELTILGQDEEFYEAELDFTNDSHDALDEGHPYFREV